uniref:Calponin-homology (CH) domain-containing protein n=1 Tax=Rhabditophanes sp. KR3021 TaxID=114890 RepID=A0AC35U4D7_9BILA
MSAVESIATKVQETVIIEKVEETSPEAPIADATPAPESTEETKAAVDEAIEQLKTLQEDPIAWISAQRPAAIHKVNHLVCNWIAGIVNEGAETPVATVPGKHDNVTKNQFLAFLKDGTILTQLANKLAPGSIETVHEGEEAATKENQTANIEAFVKFVKEKLELGEEQVFTAADIQDKGKEGYQAVFNTLARVGMAVKEKFDKDGLDIDNVTESAAKVAQNKIFVTLLGLFNRAKAALTAKKAVAEKPAEGGEATEQKKEEEVEKSVEGTVTEPAKEVSETH